MRSAIWLGAVLMILLLNAGASFRVVGYDLFTTRQKVAWLLCVWLLPLLGFLLALQITSESRRTLPTGRSSSTNLGDPGWSVLGAGAGVGDGSGGHCSGSGHGADAGSCGDGGGSH